MAKAANENLVNLSRKRESLSKKIQIEAQQSSNKDPYQYKVDTLTRDLTKLDQLFNENRAKLAAIKRKIGGANAAAGGK